MCPSSNQDPFKGVIMREKNDFLFYFIVYDVIIKNHFDL